jgi:hypothetical protein
MSANTVKLSAEDLLRMPVKGLKDQLPLTLEEIQKHGIGKLLEEYPDFLARLLNRLKLAGAAGLFNETTGVSDRLTDLLWEGVAFRAGQSIDMKSVLQKNERDCHVNIEASDSPFAHHFIITKEGLTGGSGLLHFKDEDFRFMGRTDVMVELLTGDLPLGLSNIRLQIAGHPGWISRIAPILREVGKLLKGR